MAILRAEVFALPWPRRNVQIEAAVRDYLDRKHQADEPLSTYDLASCICGDAETTAKCSQVLTKLAKHLDRFATHDGETTTRYGKTQTRWRWWGQRITAGDTSAD